MLFIDLNLWQMSMESGQRIVIALQDYEPFGDNDLLLEKDQEYILINASHSDWWTVKNCEG